MNDRTSKPEDFVELYRRAFSEYGTEALWNMRLIENPTRRRRLGDYTGAANARRHGGSAVPLTKMQSHVLRLFAAERSPDSYIAGGVALNRDGPRFSGDIDVFQDSEQRLESAAEADAKALAKAWPTHSA